jgi:hypothetical protein
MNCDGVFSGKGHTDSRINLASRSIQLVYSYFRCHALKMERFETV